MGYYQGDYYRGDYYQGFPLLGAIGGALKLGKKFIAPALKKVGGAVVKGAKKVLGTKAGKAAVGTVGIGTVVLPPIVGGGGQSADEVKTQMREGIAVGTGGGRIRLGRDGQPCAKKYGGRGCSHRMNVSNPRALRRSIRRARGFAKLARKVMTFPISKPPRGRGLFKKKR